MLLNFDSPKVSTAGSTQRKGGSAILTLSFGKKTCETKEPNGPVGSQRRRMKGEDKGSVNGRGGNFAKNQQS